MDAAIAPARTRPPSPTAGEAVSLDGSQERPHITIRGLSKNFHGLAVYDNFDFDFPRGRFVSIFGPNGCGKSTLINLVSGLIPMDSGHVRFDGKTLDQITIGYVFQDYRGALFPWLRAGDNVEYPLKCMNLSKAERGRRVDALVARLGVRIDLNKYPYQMSGGQQQLLSIMRAVVVEPEVLFLDEPFSALDYEMTLFMREQLQHLFLDTGTTTLFVSHDLEEAVFLADHILLLSRPPARVAAFTAYGGARPRSAATLSDPDFVQVKSHCLEIFQREVRK